MGVSGSGKSTVAKALARHFAATFIEGDLLHSPASIAKMSRSDPLNDDDRMPWLTAVGRAVAAPECGAIASCSALRRRYRDTLRGQCPEIVFLHLDVPRVALEARLNARLGHFMSPALLDSQLDTLEPLEEDEAGFVVEAGVVDSVVSDAITVLRALEARDWG